MNPPFAVNASKIKQLREKSGLTQAELAKKAKVSQASVSKAENYGRSSRQVAKKLADCFGVTLDDLRLGQGGEATESVFQSEQKMQSQQLSPETLELMAGVQEILDSRVETVVAALKASIQAFRLSARALRREGDRKRAKGAAAMGGPE
jgi:transcriptional regulator with XRE-family HTH domain